MNCSVRTLVVAPYVGEFGWELMNWQARVRWVVGHGDYERVVVGAEADRRALEAAAEPDAETALEDLEKWHIDRVLRKYDGNRSHAARVLGIALTSRDTGQTPLAGVPHHARDSYLGKLVAAGYNGGPHHVARWLEARGKRCDMDEFVEEIPIQETRGYVKRVLRTYAAYRMLYGRQGESPVRLASRLPPPAPATASQ